LFQVTGVPLAGTLELLLQGQDSTLGQDRHAILVSFAIAHEDEVLGKIYVLNTEPEAFHQAQAAAIKQFTDELIYTGQAGNDLLRFSGTKNGGQLLGLIGPRHIDVTDFLVEHIAVKKEESSQSLVLGGRGNVVIGGKMSQERLYFGGAHFGRMAFMVKEDKALYPTEVGFFCTKGIVIEAGAFAGQIEQLFGRWCRHWQLP